MSVQTIPANTTAAYLAGDGTLFIRGARLVAGSDAASAIIRETDGSGRVLAKLSAGAALAVDEWNPPGPVAYQANVHVTITGTGPQLNLFV